MQRLRRRPAEPGAVRESYWITRYWITRYWITRYWITRYWITWITRREPGSTITRWSFTTLYSYWLLGTW